MGYKLECEVLGKPATIHVDTIDELRELMNYGNVVKTRATAGPLRLPTLPVPDLWGFVTLPEVERTPAVARSGRRGAKSVGSREWGPAVHRLAEKRGISLAAARSELAAQKHASKLRVNKRRQLEAATTQQ